MTRDRIENEKLVRLNRSLHAAWRDAVVLLCKAEERAAEVKVGGVKKAKIHSRASRKAFRVAPPINSASSGSRSAGVVSGESRWTSAV